MKHLIKIESTAHGVLGVRHAGRDQQYCEAGEQVILKWQPDAKWGLQEAHYTDGNGNVTPIDLTRVKVDGVNVVAFVMPDANITVGGTFKRFVAQDWTTNDKENAGKVLGIDETGNIIPVEGGSGGDSNIVTMLIPLDNNPDVGDFVFEQNVIFSGADTIHDVLEEIKNNSKISIVQIIVGGVKLLADSVDVTTSGNQQVDLTCYTNAFNSDDESGYELFIDFHFTFENGQLVNNEFEITNIAFKVL